MTRINYCFSICVLGIAMLCGGVLQAQDGVANYPGSIGLYNPCNNSLVVVTGTNTVRIDDDTHVKRHDHDRDHRPEVSVELKFVGYGTDAADNPYRAVLVAKGRVAAESTMYDLPFHSMWFGRKNAPSFSVDGTIRVFAQGGTATGSSITQFDTSCHAGERDPYGDGDHDDSH